MESFFRRAKINNQANMVLSMFSLLFIAHYTFMVHCLYGPGIAYVLGFIMMAVFVRNYCHLSKFYQSSFFDSLTGLPNRLSFFRDIETKKSELREDEHLHVFMMDMNRFKHVNDLLGHTFGDQLLIQISDRLRGAFLKQDNISIYRFGGDEFAILTTRSTEDNINTNIYIAQILLRALDRPFIIDESSIMSDISIGSIEYSHQTKNLSVNELIRRAELAMYFAKKSHLGYSEFSINMLDDTNESDFKISNGIKRAVDNNELFVEYQPKYDVKKRTIVAAEVLVRWRHPELGIVSPFTFVKIAEELGVIDEIFIFTLKTAIKDVTHIQKEYGIGIGISVNITSRNIENSLLISEIEKILVEHNFQPERLTLEITETGLTGTTETSLRFLNAISNMGIKLSIDDFGTGYSSLAYLRQLPVTEIKIDQMFVRGILTNDKDRMIVDSTIKIAQSLKFDLVAEGVETEQMMNELASMGCNIIQGYHISKPKPIKDFAALVLERSHLGIS